jgi:hypothetical protein
MNGWTRGELEKIGAAEELEIAPLGRDGTLRKPVTVWVVRVGDDFYVRSWRGPTGTWFRAARRHREGRIHAGGVEKDVTFAEEPDRDINDRIDAAYRTKLSPTRRAVRRPDGGASGEIHDDQTRAARNHTFVAAPLAILERPTLRSGIIRGKRIVVVCGEGFGVLAVQTIHPTSYASEDPQGRVERGEV